MKAGTTADVRRACAEFGQPPLPKRTATSLVCAALLRQLAVEIKVRGQVIRTSQGINCAAFFLSRRFRIEPLETKKRLRLLGAVLVSGSSNYARSCRLWHGSSQARLRLTDDLLIVIGNDPLHIDACAFDPRFVRQSLELKLTCSACLGVKRVTGRVADLPVGVSIFTEYGCRGCCVFGVMRHLLILHDSSVDHCTSCDAEVCWGLHVRFGRCIVCANRGMRPSHRNENRRIVILRSIFSGVGM